MTTDQGAIAHSPSAQQQELKEQLAHLAALETELAQQELDLTSLQTELHRFEGQYFQLVGRRYAELDQLEAELAKYLAYLNPEDLSLRQQAERAWAKAQDSQRATLENSASEAMNFRASESLKKLYRDVAKRIHPDLATDEEERMARVQLMIEANRAYEQGNTEILEAILQDWKDRPDFNSAEALDTQLQRLYRQIEQVKLRLRAIASEKVALKQSALEQIRQQTLQARSQGRDLLNEMVFEINQAIAATQRHLNEIKAKIGF